MFYSNLVYSGIRARAAEKLVSVAPGTISKVFFCNSGTEANENAMRMARMATGREKVVSFRGGFHGRTSIRFQQRSWVSIARSESQTSRFTRQPIWRHRECQVCRR